jgi:hypothetical protein
MTKIKIYTEEQIVNATNKVFIEAITFEDVNEIVRNLTPIKLPSDEEIENYARQSGLVHPFVSRGAKYVIDKIQGGNNEQQ